MSCVTITQVNYKVFLNTIYIHTKLHAVMQIRKRQFEWWDDEKWLDLFALRKKDTKQNSMKRATYHNIFIFDIKKILQKKNIKNLPRRRSAHHTPHQQVNKRDFFFKLDLYGYKIQYFCQSSSARHAIAIIIFFFAFVLVLQFYILFD